MEKKIVCDKHNYEIVVICIYFDCLEPFLCNYCFKDHQGNHATYFLSYEDNLDLEMRINEENLNFQSKLNKERKDIFKESIKISINRNQNIFTQLINEFEILIQDFSNFKDDDTEAILHEIRNENYYARFR